jgi:dihydrofolate synthase/folylpolyglutamate synthase
MNYDDSVAYMRGLLRHGMKLGNERFEALLARLGNPHQQLQVVHIAGTKGKGSTTAMAANILHAAGYRVGAYFSPFVYDLRERIQIDGEMIAKGDFARLVSEIRPHIEELALTDHGQTTEFELKTAVGLCYFLEKSVEYAVLEVGIGGRLDATNVIPQSLVSVITNIGFDHMEILGHTLGAIAGEKAGIIKEGGLCVAGIEPGEALDVVERVCRERSAKLVHLQRGKDWHSHPDGSVTIMTSARRLENAELNLKGRFQHANAALAVAALDEVAIPRLSDEVVRDGLAMAFVPGRFEVVRDCGPTIIADGAHNELAGRVLGDALAGELSARTRPVIVVVGMSRGHDAEMFLAALFGGFHPAAVISTEPSFRPNPAEEVAGAARRLRVGVVETAAQAPKAARRALEMAKSYPDALIVVTGSFYTVGDLPPAVWRTLLEKK